MTAEEKRRAMIAEALAQIREDQEQHEAVQ